MATVATPDVPSYPVHVDARPEPDHPSRGLWLVKWVLVIPHVLVLALLWAAFVVLSVVALVAILATGRYPRGIFDFNVGVLRWSWRVSYYSYGALGTDRYPPFTLAEDPDYPAHLEVDYPDHLSRGLVLVKWWLLVLPHYLILVLFIGLGARAARDVAQMQWVWEGGLITLLALVVGVALLFTGMYPSGLYNLLLGLNRWVLRVAAYAGLMTDTYPPFRLDQGGTESLAFTTGAPPPTAPATADARSVSVTARPGPALGAPGDPTPGGPTPGGPPAPSGSSWTGGRVTAVVVGVLVVLFGAAATAGAGALIVASSALREDGYLTTPAWSVSSPGHAVVSEELVLEGAWLDEGLGEVRLRAVGHDGEVFLGLATAQDAARYLGGVARTVVPRPRSVQDLPGELPAVAPADAGIWVASVAGRGQQELVLTPEPGSYVAVVMAPDGDAGVAATVDAGATLPWAVTTGVVTLVGGLLLMAAGALVITLAVRAATSSEPRTVT